MIEKLRRINMNKSSNLNLGKKDNTIQHQLISKILPPSLANNLTYGSQVVRFE